MDTNKRLIKAREMLWIVVPDDVIEGILICLPVKSLLRFRSVSKNFCALIDSSRFVKQQLDYSLKTKTNHILLIKSIREHPQLYSVDLYSPRQIIETKLPLQLDPINTLMIGSVNGLICLHIIARELCNNSHNIHQNYIIIWNLATKKYLKVSSPPPQFHRVASYGFGYDSVSDDYKILCADQFYNDNQSLRCKAVVYSMKSNYWKNIGDFPNYIDNDFCLMTMNCTVVLAYGELHWMVTEPKYPTCFFAIASFDLATEKFRLVSLPDILNVGIRINHNNDAFDIYITELCGRVCVICTFDSHRHDVWVMNKYGAQESWTKLLTVSQNYPRKRSRWTPLSYSERRGEIMMVDEDKNLFWYNLGKNMDKKVELRKFPYAYFRKANYVESLVPVAIGRKVEEK